MKEPTSARAPRATGCRTKSWCRAWRLSVNLGLAAASQAAGEATTGSSATPAPWAPKATCPLQHCSGVHKCAWQALAHYLTTNRTKQLVEVTRDGKFVEFTQIMKANYASVKVHDFVKGVNLPAIWTEGTSAGVADASRPSVLFHILVGEGVSRTSFEAAVAAAAAARAPEIWVLEHNRDAPDWANPASWPAAGGKTIIGTAGTREEGSALWRHEELTNTLKRVLQSNCPAPRLASPLADCVVTATHGPGVRSRRNMLLGYACTQT